jgi:hypothetical protein
MKTLKVSTISSFVTSALRGAKMAAEAADAISLADSIAKAVKCHGAAKAAVIRKMVRQLAEVKPAAAYKAVLELVQRNMLVDVMAAAFDADRAMRTGKQQWSETTQAAIIRAIRSGVKFRNREVAEKVFLGALNDVHLERFALWGEFDAVLERAGWHVTGFGRNRDVEPAMAIVRTTSDGLLQNSEDNVSEVTLSRHDDPETVLEFLANAGINPEKAYEYLEEIQRKGSVTITTDYNVAGETGDISTHSAMGPMDEADRWLRANAGEVEAEVLYHRPKSGDDLRSLLEDPQVKEDFMQRGAAVWADSLPQLAKNYPALEAKLHDEDGNPYKGRKAVRKLLSALAIWRVQGDMPVKYTVPNDTGSLTASGKYRPGETSIEVSLRERASLAYRDATSGQTVTSDISRVQVAYEFWTQQLPAMEGEFLHDAIRAHSLMESSLLLSGLNIPLDSIAYEQVATALVGLPKELPKGVVSRPVLDQDNEQIKDDQGRPLFWVMPWGAAWTPEGELTDNGRNWAKFVLDMRSNIREIDAHVEGVKEARSMLDSLVG